MAANDILQKEDIFCHTLKQINPFLRHELEQFCTFFSESVSLFLNKFETRILAQKKHIVKYISQMLFSLAVCPSKQVYNLEIHESRHGKHLHKGTHFVLTQKVTSEQGYLLHKIPSNFLKSVLLLVVKGRKHKCKN